MIDLPTTTTLAEIKAHNPCPSGWATLTEALGPSYGDDTPLPYARILEMNGFSDTLWAIDHCGGDWGSQILRLFAVDCAERALALYGGDNVDPRSWAAVDATRRYAAGEIGEEVLAAAGDAAGDAARAAAGDAAWAAARDVARDAAWAAAWAAARAAARDVARDAAWDVEMGWQSERLAEYLTLGIEGVPPMPPRSQGVTA